MSIGDSITLVSCLAGTMLALPALLIFLNMTFSRSTTNAAYRLARGGLVPLLAGILPLVMAGIPGAVLLSMGSIFQLAGTIIYLGILLWIFTGMAVFARYTGLRLADAANRPDNAFVEILSGAFVLTFAVAFPLVGWLVVLPVSVVMGVGGLNLALLRRQVTENPAATAVRRRHEYYEHADEAASR